MTKIVRESDLPHNPNYPKTGLLQEINFCENLVEALFSWGFTY